LVRTGAKLDTLSELAPPCTYQKFAKLITLVASDYFSLPLGEGLSVHFISKTSENHASIMRAPEDKVVGIPRFTLTTNLETGGEFLAEILRLSRENTTPLDIQIRYGSVEITVLLSGGAALLSILKTVWGVREWLSNKRETKNEVRADKNREWAREQGKAWAVLHAGAVLEGMIEEEAISTRDGWEFVFKDKTGRKFRCSLTKDCRERFKEDRSGKFSPPAPPLSLTPVIMPSETITASAS